MAESNNSKRVKKVEQKKFGTFAGVFMPSLLTILGAVMYFIVPQIVGGVGLLKTLAIILIAHSVTIATAFSISAIATNIKVKGGGLYYLISRSLGSEFGGSLGIQLYLAQTIASSFYAIAFARGAGVVLSYFNIILPEFQIALLSITLFGLMVFIGAKFVVKLQYFIFVAIVLSLLSIFLGPSSGTLETVLLTTSSIPFWVAFAMFFPAVTGIDAGVGMSGDLKDPKKSLVKGTFAAIAITLLVYLALATKIAFSAGPDALLNNPNVINQIALFAPLVLVGILMATSSSALSSLMTAPRCLVAMSEDKILPKFLNFLGKKSGKDGEPRIAILFSLAIGIGVILSGSLEFVSQIVSMFFLSVYGWINGAAFFEKISHNPSYRPTFNAPTVISFYGMIAAYAVMYLFNPAVMVLVLVLQILLFYLLYRSRKSMKIEGAWTGVFFQLIRALIKRIDLQARSVKNWRPTILAFSTKELNNHPIANLLDWIGSQSSITKLYFLRKGKISRDVEENKGYQQNLINYTKNNNLEIFPRSVLTTDYQKTMESLIQAETLGHLPLNTVLVDYDHKIKINELADSVKKLDKNLIVMRNQAGFSNFKRIDVWWSSKNNGNFMILLAYLISHSKRWLEQGATIKVFHIVKDLKSEQSNIRAIEKMIEESRIENIELEIVEQGDREINKIVNETSKDSDLAMIGLTDVNLKDPKKIASIIEGFTRDIKVSLIVFANDKIDFRVN